MTRTTPRLLTPRLLLSTLLPLSLAACASSTAGASGAADTATSAADGTPFTLQPGQVATLADDSRLHYARLVSDSRCPPDVQCVWAGDAIIALQWTPAGGGAQAFELHTGLEPRSQAIGTRSVTLQALARGDQPEATLQVDATP